MKKQLISLALLATSAQANEGMWQPHQLPEIAPQLQALGLALDPNSLTSLTEFPMNAVISLGGCTASFVSPKGLVVTNHHCAYGSIQYNSTAEKNLLQQGFLAKNTTQELPAAPGARVFVTEQVTNVTDKITGALTNELTDVERYKTIDANRKKLIAECEQQAGYRCSVPSFHYGMEYFLIKQMEIRDVRLVYAPASSIGKYGGDIDNWMWPRHTGDFSFFRAYVAPNGQPADFSQENVPYQPKNFLKVSAKGVAENDFVMVAGYPGRTNRYRTAEEVKNQFEWTYPQGRDLQFALIDQIKAVAPEGSDARIAYESRLAGLANYGKNYQSMVESYQHSTLYQRKQTLEQDLNAWIAADATRQQQYGHAIETLDQTIADAQATKERDLLLGYISGSASLPNTAARLYRLAQEKQKPDSERERGYQQRDWNRIEQGLDRISRRYDETVEKALLSMLLARYSQLPAEQHIASLDQFYGLTDGFNADKLSQRLDAIYASTKLHDAKYRKFWMNQPVDAFKQSGDALFQYAVAAYDDVMALEKQDKAIIGALQKWRPRYMEALIAYYKDQNKPVYADANSTLRVTYGQVKGNQPRDGLRNLPFTRMQGIAEKATGQAPFDASEKLLGLIKQKQWGEYGVASLDSVPVNYLSTVDTTGGNSGSPTLNSKAELVGLLFDGVYESIIGDWDFDDNKNRSIHVDSRYMLWVMDELDGAQNLLDEMDIVR